jgi:hypothetical protein
VSAETTEELLKRYQSLLFDMKAILEQHGRKTRSYGETKGLAWELYRRLQARGVAVEAPSE